MAFWGVEVKPGKPYTHAYQEYQHRLRVTQATLGSGKSGGKTVVQVNVGDTAPILLCSLIPQKTESCHLELEFKECHDVVFSVLGSMSVHLSGYFLQLSIQGEADGDESDSYGEDIAETESECSGSFGSEDDEYESDFIDDDDDVEMYSVSPLRKSNVVIEEIVEDKPVSGNSSPHRIKKKKKRQSSNLDNKNDPLQILEDGPADGNPSHPLIKRKNQVSDSDDNIDSHRQIVEYVKPRNSDSEDVDGFPIFSLKTEKKTKKADGNVKSGSKMSEDKKRKVDAIIPDTTPTSGCAAADYSIDKSKKKKKKKDRIKDLHEAVKSSLEENPTDAGNHHAGDEDGFVLVDDRNQIADIEAEKRSEAAGKDEPVETKRVAKLKNKKKAKASKIVEESQTNETGRNTEDKDSPAVVKKLQAHKDVHEGSSILEDVKLSLEEKSTDAENHHAGGEEKFVLADDRNPIEDIEAEKRSDTAGKDEPIETKRLGKLKNKKKVEAFKTDICLDESHANGTKSNAKCNDSPSGVEKLQAHKEVDEGSSMPTGSALESTGKGKKKRNKAKVDIPHEKSFQKETIPTTNVEDTPVNQLSNNTVVAVSDAAVSLHQTVKNKNNGIEKDDLTINQNALQDLVQQEEKALPVKTRSFSNGLKVEELSMGKPDGKRASLGGKVSVNFTGKLQNGKIFDSTVGKKPYTFRLGIGEVIEGWDIGIKGMRVGDKRRLTIPPSLGYGEKTEGSIPGNSWLIFDVELANVK